MKGIITGVLLLISIGVVGWLGYSYYLEYQHQVRNQAVDGCLANGRYNWEGPNPQDPNLIVTHQEPDRFWYKTCMEEKGYSLNVEL